MPSLCRSKNEAQLFTWGLHWEAQYKKIYSNVTHYGLGITLASDNRWHNIKYSALKQIDVKHDISTVYRTCNN